MSVKLREIKIEFKYKPQKMEKAKDAVYALIKGAIGTVPVAGALASELLSVLIASPLERRRDELLTSIGERLLKLEQESRIDLVNLKENDLFIDTVIEACQKAIKTSDADKIEYYKKVIENTALGQTPDKTLGQIYLNAIDRYTSWHVKILVLFDDPIGWFESRHLNKIVLTKGSLSSIAKTAYPELPGGPALYDLIFSELQRDGMLGSDALQNLMSPGTPLGPTTTKFGKDFLRFICGRGDRDLS